MRWQSVVVVGLALSAGCGSDGSLGQGPEGPSADVVSANVDVFGIYQRTRGPLGCSRAEADDFDFWVGRWRITNAQGDPSGVSVIRRELQGCLVSENFAGGQGRSLSRYDQIGKQWLQDYVDTDGFTVRLFGGLDGSGVMRMEDQVRSIPNGPALKSQFAWTPNPDGSVRQQWNLSFDGGANYIDNFNGTYRVGGFEPPAPPVANICVTRPGYRDLDALVGAWTVERTGGGRAGTVVVRLDAGQCLLEEHFTGTDGYQSRTFVYFDRFIRTWFRTTVDNQGRTFRLGGAVAAGVATLQGNGPGREGSAVPVRLTWNVSDPTAPAQQWERQDQAGGWVPLAGFVWRPAR